MPHALPVGSSIQYLRFLFFILFFAAVGFSNLKYLLVLMLTHPYLQRSCSDIIRIHKTTAIESSGEQNHSGNDNNYYLFIYLFICYYYYDNNITGKFYYYYYHVTIL